MEASSMDLLLQGKRALVTGSSAGLGEAIARTLAAEGAVVVVHGRSAQRAYALAEDIGRRGGAAVVVLGDFAADRGAEAIAAGAIERLGGIDILVNNAGGTADKLLWQDTSLRAWREAYERNVLSAVVLIDSLLPGMRRSGWGRIVNISSVAGVMPQPTGPDYSASKAALNNLGFSLSKVVAASGVTVNTVAPGMIHTPKLEQVFRQMATLNGWVPPGAPWEDIHQALLKVSRVPLGRFGRVDEVAHAVAFLCSPLAAYITGATLRIDGGVVPAI
jgi:3-oxoacyl-[acyl-carrier protein] reductase